MESPGDLVTGTYGVLEFRQDYRVMVCMQTYNS